MQAQRILVIILFVVLMISSCQPRPPATQNRIDTAQPLQMDTQAPPVPTRTDTISKKTEPAKTKTLPATNTSAPQYSVEGIPAQDQQGESADGIPISLSSQAMESASSFAKEYPGLKEEVYYSGGFGGGGGQICILPEITEPPLVGYQDSLYDQTIDVCVVGFSRNRPVEISLYAPDGTLVGSKEVHEGWHEDTFTIGDVNGQIEVSRLFGGEPSQNQLKIWENVDILTVTLWFPVGLPEGDWKVIAVSGDLRREIDVPVPLKVFNSEIRISTLPSLAVDPFNKQSCTDYRTGDTVYILGSGFQPNTEIPLGIYYSTNEFAETPDGDHGNLFTKEFGTLVSIRDEGDFLIQYKVPENAKDGLYVVNPFINDDFWMDIIPDFKDYCFNVISGNPTPTPETKPLACPGAPPTRLSIGDRGSISLVPPDPNTVRERPGKKQPRLGLLQPGEQIEILEGPQCADSWVWWKVVSLKTGLEGWTAEGDSKNYWIVPEE